MYLFAIVYTETIITIFAYLDSIQLLSDNTIYENV